MKKYIAGIILIFITGILFAQQTVGLFTHETGEFDGYVLFSPISSTNSYLIDKCGKQVHTWASNYRPGQSLYLLEDGSLLRTGNIINQQFNGGGTGGIIEKIDWDGNVTWTYSISSATECQHHDIFPMPNGNILAVVWEAHTNTETINEGQNPSLTNSTVWSEKIIELQPAGNNAATIVWEWHAWDHLVQDYDASKNNYGVVTDHPELIDVNYSANAANEDWLHINSVDYNAQLNQVLLSSHNFNEVWIIDHSTTTAEAATHSGGQSGKGGDILYRWGNPAAYDRGSISDKKLFGQHNANWIPAGYPDENKIMIFNNGITRPQGNYSTIEIIETPVQMDGSYSVASGQAFLPASSYWTYTAPTPASFYSANISGARRLSNGNTMVCEGTKGNFFELDANNLVVWDYINPVQVNGPITQGTTAGNNAVFRCTFYEAGFAGFTGKDLTAGSPIELNPLPYSCDMVTGINTPATRINNILLFPNPATSTLNFTGSNIQSATVYNLMGQVMFTRIFENKENSISLQTLASGTYIIRIYQPGEYSLFRFVKN